MPSPPLPFVTRGVLAYMICVRPMRQDADGYAAFCKDRFLARLGVENTGEDRLIRNCVLYINVVLLSLALRSVRKFT